MSSGVVSLKWDLVRVLLCLLSLVNWHSWKVEHDMWTSPLTKLLFFIILSSHHTRLSLCFTVWLGLGIRLGLGKCPDCLGWITIFHLRHVTTSTLSTGALIYMVASCLSNLCWGRTPTSTTILLVLWYLILHHLISDDLSWVLESW